MIPLQPLVRNAYRKNCKFDGDALSIAPSPAQPAVHLAGEEIQDSWLDYKRNTSCFIYYLHTDFAFGEENKNYFKWNAGYTDCLN